MIINNATNSTKRNGIESVNSKNHCAAFLHFCILFYIYGCLTIKPMLLNRITRACR